MLVSRIKIKPVEFAMTPAENEIKGCYLSPSNVKDYDFSTQLLPKLSVGSSGDVDLRPWCTEVSNQQWLSSCVANAAADMFEILANLDGNKAEQISRLHIYFNGRSRMSEDGVTNMSSYDEGMYIRSAFEAMNVLGIVPESMWPYDPSRVNDRPTIKCMFYGLKHKLHSYYRIRETGNDLLEAFYSALRSNHPVEFAIPVSEEFRKCREMRPISAPGASTSGLHAILAVGVMGENILIRNSWGPGWGDEGYALLEPGWISEFALDPFVGTRGHVFKS